MARGLDKQFMADLGDKGSLQPLVDAVKRDRDLSLEIRKKFLNVYFKGYSTPMVYPKPRSAGYLFSLHKKFCVRELGEPVGEEKGPDETAEESGKTASYYVFDLSHPEDVDRFVGALPLVKHKATKLRRYANELEVEQWIIRAGSREAMLARQCNVEYLAIDRQPAAGVEGQRGRADILGYYWQFRGRRQGQTVPMVVVEVKHMLNADIQHVHKQLQRYQEAVASRLDALASELETIASQKAELGLISPRIATLKVDRDPKTVKYVAVLVDYNPQAGLERRLKDSLERMRSGTPQDQQFFRQFEIFHLGFGMWRRYGKGGDEYLGG